MVSCSLAVLGQVWKNKWRYGDMTMKELSTGPDWVVCDDYPGEYDM